MTGRLVGVVGPSGVGKDTVMEAVAARSSDLFLIRRVITRPATSGGEVFEGVSDAEFESRCKAGDFALDWQAHGLRYGVPKSAIRTLAQKRDGMVNLSRAVLDSARRIKPGMVVLSFTAGQETLRERLRARGREDEAEIERRLVRAAAYRPQGRDIITIANDDSVDAAVEAVLTALYRPRG